MLYTMYVILWLVTSVYFVSSIFSISFLHFLMAFFHTVVVPKQQPVILLLLLFLMLNLHISMYMKELCKSRSCLIINVVLGLGITRSNKTATDIYHIQNKTTKKWGKLFKYMKIKSAFIISTSLKSINAICRELFGYFIIKMVAPNKTALKKMEKVEEPNWWQNFN